MSLLKVLTYIDVAAVLTDRDHSIDVIDDLLPHEATLVQLDSDSWGLEGYTVSLRVSQ